MIQSAAEYAEWFNSPPSRERNHYLRQEQATTSMWMQILDEYPRCQLEVCRNWYLPLEVMERLRGSSDCFVRFHVQFNSVWQEAHPEDAPASDVDLDELVDYDLTPHEREVLRQGLFQWGGPASCTEQLAVAMGFVSVSELYNEGDRIGYAIRDGRPLRHLDWVRALVATEIVFMSDVFGAGVDWEAVAGIDDVETLNTLRGLQRHILGRALLGRAFGTRDKS